MIVIKFTLFIVIIFEIYILNGNNVDALVFEMEVLCGIFMQLLKLPKIVKPLLRSRSEGGIVPSISTGPITPLGTQ
jgi:hypothetical protein